MSDQSPQLGAPNFAGRDYGSGPTPDPGTVLYDAQVVFGSVNAGINDGDTINTPLVGINRLGGGLQSVDNIFFLETGLAQAATMQVRNGRRMIRTLPTAINGSVWRWSPGSGGGSNQWPIGFNDAMAAATGAVSPKPTMSAPVIRLSAWIQKMNSGDGSDCRFFFGFYYDRIITPTRPIARIGLLGDGAGGYRFGSVNCPDGGASTTQNAPTDIDANFIAPPELANPGVVPFHVEIALIPPTPKQVGMWAAYLNGGLIQTFGTVANFPRGYFSGTNINDGYRAIQCGFGAYPDGVAIVPVPLIGPPRVRVVEDWTL